MAKIIALESLDGGGKTTQTNLIQNYLEKNGLKVKTLHFSKDNINETSPIISAYLRGELGDKKTINPIFIANMYALNRFLYLPNLSKDLYENDIIILDRYVFSNMAYQGAKFENDTQSEIIKKWIYDLEFDFMGLPYPDLNIFFDIPIEIISKRLSTLRTSEDRIYLNGKLDIHEIDIEYQKQVRLNYLSFLNYKNFIKIDIPDETFSPTQIFDKYKTHIDMILNNFSTIDDGIEQNSHKQFTPFDVIGRNWAYGHV